MTTKRIILDVVAALSAVAVFVSNVLSAVEDSGQAKRLSSEQWVQLVSIAVFLGTIVVTVHLVLAELERLRETHEGALRAMRVAEAAQLMGDVERWCDDHPEAVHVHSARDVAQHLVDFVPNLVRDLEQYCVSARAAGTMVVPDQSPVHDLLANLAERLPEGGAWLGITLLEQEKTWADPDEAFSRFASTMRRRASREIKAARLYHFSSETVVTGMANSLARESGSGISIRYRSGGDRRDLSILYAPPEDERNRITTSLSEEPVKQLNNQKYQMICAVAFQTRADGVLRAASVYGPKNREALALESWFELAWSTSLPCPPAVDLEGAKVVRPRTTNASAAV